MLRFMGLCLMIGVATPLLAQRPGGFGGGITTAMLVDQKSVQEEIKLTDDQVAKAKKVTEDVRKKYDDDLKAARKDKDREKSAAIGKKIAEETNKGLTDVLKPDQLKRIKEIELQLGGLRALSRDEVTKALKLTDKQLDELKGRGDDLAKESRDLFKEKGGFEKVRTMSMEAAAKFVSTLSDDQKKIYKEMTGKKFEGKIEPPRFGPPNKGDKE
jgi:membrane protein involved in colicin uptake